MRFNPLKLQPGDIVILDKDFRNSSEVKILYITLNGMFSTIVSPDNEGETWDVMTNRLSIKQ